MLGYLAQHFALTRVTAFKMNTVTTEENLLCRGPDKLQGGEGEWSDGLRLWMSSLGSTPCYGHCIAFLGKTHYSRSASHHPGTFINGYVQI